MRVIPWEFCVDNIRTTGHTFGMESLSMAYLFHKLLHLRLPFLGGVGRLRNDSGSCCWLKMILY